MVKSGGYRRRSVGVGREEGRGNFECGPSGDPLGVGQKAEPGDFGAVAHRGVS